LLRLPENMIGEIVDGELIASPRPTSRHALASSVIGGELTGPFHRGRGGPGGWVILFQPELHLDDHVVVPDLAGWRRERMSTYPDVPWFTMAPDWACEILSPSTALLDRTRKQEIYRQNAVAWLCFVDPTARTIEVLRRGEQGWLVVGTFGGEGEARIPPFDAVAIDVGSFWDIPPPTRTL
jgi:Uma2 family endonuclease